MEKPDRSLYRAFAESFALQLSAIPSLVPVVLVHVPLDDAVPLRSGTRMIWVAEGRATATVVFDINAVTRGPVLVIGARETVPEAVAFFADIENAACIAGFLKLHTDGSVKTLLLEWVTMELVVGRVPDAQRPTPVDLVGFLVGVARLLAF